uniref:Uncharacterized protein n=1 Tax=Meloidogyne incognita TaxID=6306 RepID=A0A914N4J1_MELIC
MLWLKNGRPSHSVGEVLTEQGDVFEFWRESSANSVVGLSHTFNAICSRTNMNVVHWVREMSLVQVRA